MTTYHKELLKRRASFDDKSYAIMEVLCAHADTDGRCFPGLRTISDLSGVSINTVRGRLGELEQSDDIAISKSGQSQEYQILWPVDVDTPVSITVSNTDTPTDTVYQDCVSRVSILEETVSALCQKIEELCQSQSSALIPKKKIEEEDKEVERSAHAPAHFQAFESQSTGYSKHEQPFVDVLKDIVRDIYKTVKVKELVQMAIGFDLTPQDLQRLFGDREGFWYTASHGKREGLPPYVQNVINDLRTAVVWSQEHSPESNKLETQAREEFKFFEHLPRMNRNQKSQHLQQLPRHLKDIYNALGTSWQKSPDESQFVKAYLQMAPAGVPAHD